MPETSQETTDYLERQIKRFKVAIRIGKFCPKSCRHWFAQGGRQVGPDWHATFCDKYKKDLHEEVIAGEGFSNRLDECWGDVHK